MKRWIVLTLVIGLAACAGEPTSPDFADAPDTPDLTLQADAHTGNGFPQGAHDYKLNIIGVPHGKTADMDDNNGRRIFVLLNGGETVTNAGGKWKTDTDYWKQDSRVNKILLVEGDGYGVLDANATDKDGAQFMLPDPCVGDDSTDGCTPVYDVYARALGTPNGKAIVTTCADEDGDGYDDYDDIWCGSNQLEVERKAGRSKAELVNDELLRMVVTIDPTSDPELYNCVNGDPLDTDVSALAPSSYDVYLFDRCFENYFWNFDNNGLKLLELRFYAVPAV
jgi:hypothetical protein